MFAFACWPCEMAEITIIMLTQSTLDCASSFSLAPSPAQGVPLKGVERVEGTGSLSSSPGFATNHLYDFR